MTIDIEDRARRSTRRVILVAGVAGVLLVGLGLAGGLWLGRQSDTPSTRTSASPKQTTSASSSPAPVGSPTTATLDGLRWMDTNGIFLPVSAQGGPQQVGNRASGFAHTPTGALMAAVHIAPRTDAAMGSDIFRPTIQDQVIGDDQPKLLSTVEADYKNQRDKSGIAEGKPIRRSTTVVRGFRMSTYATDVTYLNVLLSDTDTSGQTVLVDFRLQVRWSGSDWKLNAPVNGQWRSATAQVGSTAGYTLFPER